MQPDAASLHAIHVPRAPATRALHSLPSRFKTSKLPFSLPLPAHAVLRILKEDPFLGKLVPNLVGPREVSLFLGLRALCDQCLNVLIGQPLSRQQFRSDVAYTP